MKRRFWTIIPLVILYIILILDSKTAIMGVQEGITLCIYTIIPSLFPFIFLSTVLSSKLSGQSFSFLRPVGRLCGIPSGAESILVLGILGGYPVGAQSIYLTYRRQGLLKEDAKRMMGFCNNAGPSFIFGMLGGFFDCKYVPWIIWTIQIISALLVGSVLPNKSSYICDRDVQPAITVTEALKISISSLVNISGWVILFRVLICLLTRWILWTIPQIFQGLTIGILELSNGCLYISNISKPGLRFIMASGILSLGGLCVAMQTSAVTRELGTGSYFPGKVLQCVLSVFIACITQYHIFPEDECIVISPFDYIGLVGLTIVLIIIIRKITVDFPEKLLYNSKKYVRKGSNHAVSKKNSSLV